MPLSNTCQFTERERGRRVTATSFQFPPIFLLLHSPLDRLRREIPLSPLHRVANSISDAWYSPSHINDLQRKYLVNCQYLHLLFIPPSIFVGSKALSVCHIFAFFCVVAPQSGLDICGRRNETNWLKKCRVTRCDTVQFLAVTAVIKLAYLLP